MLRASVRPNDDIVARIGGDEFALQLTFSCVIVECAAGDTVESLLERADAALDEANPSAAIASSAR